MTDFEKELKPYLDFVIEQTSMMAPIPEKISYNICAALIRVYCESKKTTIEPLTGEFEIEMEVTSCCKIGPITSENYCPNCGKKIVKP